MWQHIICLYYDQNSCIIVACENMYTMESKDEFVFVDFFFDLYNLFVTNVSCNLSKVINEILVTNVTCD
jgi:hypothetical protein